MKKIFFIVSALYTLAYIDIAIAGPITFNSALPLSEGVGILVLYAVKLK